MRLMRRFLFRDSFLLRFGRLVPHYRVNRNQADPRQLVGDYSRLLAQQSFVGVNGRVLEIGVGATNSTGYEFAAQFAPDEILLFEPFVAFAAEDDRAMLTATAARHQQPAGKIADRVRRLTSLASVPDASVDLILSSSVLEHVSEPDKLFRELRRVLKPNGAMLHLVDYRDHFFKYPLHFLQFSRGTWDRWLNPGDLPRWRVYDHLEHFRQTGLVPNIVERTTEDAAFAQVGSHLAKEFRRDEPLLAVGNAALWVTVSRE